MVRIDQTTTAVIDKARHSRVTFTWAVIYAAQSTGAQVSARIRNYRYRNQFGQALAEASVERFE